MNEVQTTTPAASARCLARPALYLLRTFILGALVVVGGYAVAGIGLVLDIILVSGIVDYSNGHPRFLPTPPALQALLAAMRGAAPELTAGQSALVAMPRMEHGAQIYLVDGPTGLHSRARGTGPRDLSRVALWRRTWSGRGPNETGVFLFHGDRLVGFTSVTSCDLNIDDAPLLQAQHRFARVECRPPRGRWHPQESECRPQWNPTCTLVVVGAE